VTSCLVSCGSLSVIKTEPGMGPATKHPWVSQGSLFLRGHPAGVLAGKEETAVRYIEVRWHLLVNGYELALTTATSQPDLFLFIRSDSPLVLYYM
jgi:hypothetical protein